MNQRKKNQIIVTSVTLVLLIGLFTVTPLHGTRGAEENPDASSPVEVVLLDNEDTHILLEYHIGDYTFTPVQINGVPYYHLHLGEESTTVEIGAPQLPLICRSVIIPGDQQMAVNVTSGTYQEYQDIQLAPTKGPLSHNDNPDDIPYIFGPSYTTNAWYPGALAVLHDPYILRDFRGQVVQVNPFQYNPVTQTLRVYTQMTVEITAVGQGGPNTLNQDEPEVVTSDFRLIYERHFLNFPSGTGTGGSVPLYNPVGEVGNMLIICYDNFYSAMVPFVTWKNMKGIPTVMVNVSTIGSTATAIKTYIFNYYTTKGVTFVLLVGDATQVPPYMAGGAASDPSYTYVVGNDHYPDLFIGRFSAENSAQVATQATRSIEYERDPLAGGAWYHKGTGVASSQGAGVGDEGEADWQHMRNIRTKLMASTYTEVDELYDGSQGGNDSAGNPTAAMVSTALNNGRSLVNYCGHGSTTSWGTSYFDTNGINQLTNDNMLPFVTCVACLNGNFASSTCFAEAFLRATNNGNGEPTGAIGVFASSISQSWAPPMDAQDEINDILVGLYPTNIKHSLGGLCFNGVMRMNDNYGSSGYTETDAWHLFGDPSLQIRTDTPTAMNVVHSPTIPDGATTFPVTVVGVANALCALSQDGELLGNAYTDATGYALITLSSPIPTPGPLDLVVTAYNKIPYNATIFQGDASPPVITNVAYSPLEQIVGGFVNITCTVTDNGGVDTVLVSLVDPEGTPHTGIAMSHRAGTNTYYYNSTYGIPGIYHVTIWANDSTGNSNTVTGYTFPVYLQHTYTLSQGWNLITVPVDTDWTAEDLGQQISGCTVVLMFNASTQIFTTHVVGTPWDDFPILDGVGYFIYMSGGTTSAVIGLPCTTVSVPISLGWNIIGWYHEDPTNAAALCSSIPGVTVASKFDAETQQFISHIAVKGTPPWDNFVIYQGMGIFIYTTQTSTWQG